MCHELVFRSTDQSQTKIPEDIRGPLIQASKYHSELELELECPSNGCPQLNKGV